MSVMSAMFTAQSTTLSPFEKSAYISQLSDAIELLRSINSNVAALNKNRATRTGLHQLVEKLAAFLTMFYEHLHVGPFAEPLSIALGQLWSQCEDKTLRVLVDLYGVTKRQDTASIFQWGAARSTSSISSEIARLTSIVDDLSASSIMSLGPLIMKAHLPIQSRAS